MVLKMLTFKKTIFFFSSFLLLFLLVHPQAEAASDCGFTTYPSPPLVGPFSDNQVKLIFDKEKVANEIKNLRKEGGVLRIGFPGSTCGGLQEIQDGRYGNPNFLKSNIEYPITSVMFCGLLSEGSHQVTLVWEVPNTWNSTVKNTICLGSYPIATKHSECKVGISYNGIGDINSTNWRFTVSDIKLYKSYNLTVKFDNIYDMLKDYFFVGGTIEGEIPADRIIIGSHNITVYENDWLLGKARQSPICSKDFPIGGPGTPPPLTLTPVPTSADCAQDPCNKGDCSTNKCNVCPGCPGDPNKPPAVAQLKPICDQLDAQFKDKCWTCMAGGDKTWTAIGCLSNDFSTVIRDYIFVIGISIAGGTSFLYFLYGAFLILTSAGNAEMIEQAKQIIVSALSGLLLIIFSIFLLRVIGVDILKLPGFN